MSSTLHSSNESTLDRMVESEPWLHHLQHIEMVQTCKLGVPKAPMFHINSDKHLWVHCIGKGLARQELLHAARATADKLRRKICLSDYPLVN